MANCTVNQRNYVSTPADLMHGLSNLIYDATGWVQNKTETFLKIIEGTNVSSHQEFVENNNEVMKSLMKLNLNQRDNVLNVLGNNAHMNGSSDVYSPEILKPSYVEENNYLEFAQSVQSEESRGNISTRMNNWQDYGDTANLYPDELAAFSSGTDVSKIYSFGSGAAAGYASTSESSFNIWNVGCERNSILYKTKKLYNQRKINTIVARFGTGADIVSPIKYNGQIATQYGESRGRNLLTKEAENSFKGGYNINGYKNPYCRVWTHHYKYDSIYKTMRPFSYIDKQDGRGGYNGSETLKEVNNWSNFKKHEDKVTDTSWGWRKDNDGYDKSVMSNGMINFAPMFHSDDSKKIHTKQCMFSIENLAWKDYDPYNFEKCLSWEQRGPNGGRIMWFPPYGLTFNETTQARWNAHSFIGRGEEMYTYQDTVRSGTLSFIMVVDHPSIIDYVFGLHNEKNQVKDNDIHRYFAGCDKDTLVNAAKPTPMTDEYEKYLEYDSKGANEEEETVTQATPPSVNISKISVSCYFPNNYSGYYDNNTFDDDPNTVSSMKYLLVGQAGGVKNWNPLPSCVLNSNDTTFNANEGKGTYHGYAMGNAFGSYTDEYLIVQQGPRFLLTNNAKMSDISDSGWFYRIDYNPDFTWPTGNEKYINTIDQVSVKGKEKRTITQIYSYNAQPEETSIENEINISFLQFCCGVMFKKNKQEELLKFLNNNYGDYLKLHNETENTNTDNNEKSVYEKYVDVLTAISEGKCKVKSVKVIGYSSKRQAQTNQGKKRNEFLAQQRADMLKQLFMSSGICTQEVTSEIKEYSSNGNLNTNIDGEDETKNRRADLVIELENEEIQNVAEIQEETSNVNDIKNYVGYSPTNEIVEIEGKRYVLYKKEEQYWYNVNDPINDTISTEEHQDNYWRLYDLEIQKIEATYEGMKIRKREGDNNLRYDQEYYFFKKLEAHDKIIYKKLVEKLQYFDPAFHSMTPEGFNGRLTFLNQCMRQGNTLVKNESNRKEATARNLAFGRPPFCVLRLGDFYNQTIIIENLSINYDFDGGIQWDLNAEGIGVQPLLAQVNLSIKFIGGADMSGPIRRLQNAMSFNYYANTSIYDNRTDRIEYEIDNKTNIKGSIKQEGTYIYDASERRIKEIDINTKHK